MTKRSDAFEHLKQLFREGKIKIPKPDHAWLISPRDRRFFETGEMRGSWTNVMGVDPVVESNAVEPGYAYFVTTARSTMPHVEIPPDVLHQFEKALDKILWRHFWTTVEQPYRWQRTDGETVWVWGIRLFNRGLLDDPEIRWVYQKAVWLTPVTFVRRLVQR